MGRPPVHDREHLLHVAALVVVERGYDGMRYQDLSAASGVPVASLRHYFPTIDGLRHEALTHSIRAELSMLEAHADQYDEPWEQLRQFIHHAVGVDGVARRFSWLLWLEYWRVSARDPHLGRTATEVYDAWDGVVQQIIERGIVDGTFRVGDLTAEEAAFQVSAFIDGVGPSIAIAPEDDELAERLLHRVEVATRRLLGLPAGFLDAPPSDGSVVR